MARKEMDTAETDVPTTRGTSLAVKATITVVVLLLLGSAGTAVYFYKQFSNLKKNPNKVAVDESKSIIDAVGKLIVLPSGEQPTLATVTDPEKLKDQPFFASAKKGDKVLIYTNAKKAILYDPAENKIVEVAPINIGASATTPSAVSGTSTTSGTTSTKKK